MYSSNSNPAVRNRAVAGLLAALLLLTAISGASAATGACAGEQCRAEHERTLTGLLARGAFGDAVDYYGQLYSRLPSSGSAPYRVMLMDAAAAMAAAGACADVVDLLTRYTEIFSSDVEALSSLAECAGRTGDHVVQLDTLERAVGESIDADETEALWQRLHGALDLELAALERRRDFDGQIALLEDLIYRWPDRPLFYVRLAEVYAALGDDAAVNATLDAMPWSGDYGHQVAALRRGGRAGSASAAAGGAQGISGGPGVALTRRGAQYVVDAVLNDRQAVRLLIDTGASISLVRPAIAARLDNHYQAKGRTIGLATAGGNLVAHTVGIDSLAIAGRTVRNLTLAAVELGGDADIDGLLGMDYLRHFEFRIDQERALLYLSR